ncbi:ubiquinol-cytochrome c reductase iron-sulfur subunit [Thiohalospira sp.]|uniref:ubiquinol-cytochrome c reductase iron-sulfur subunit n=1 Tax=Thiohalospira sp. TaxID=3080549 RepID=UPI00397ECC34
MSKDGVDIGKRRFLTAATTVVGAAGVVYAATPFFQSFWPSRKAQAAGAPVEVDVGKLEPGQMLTVEWRGNPIWVVRRSEKMLEALPSLDDDLRDPKSEKKSQQPEYAQNSTRSIKEEYWVGIGICTHLGCSPTFRPEFGPDDLGDDWKGGFFCPCHGSRFDLAGRVFNGVPAPTNLEIPPHRYTAENKILVGEDEEEGAA